MPTDAIHATIRRATLAAHRQVEQLDAQALRDVRALYQQAADHIARQLANHAGPDGNLTVAQLRATLDQIQAILRALETARDVLLDATLRAGIQTGIAPFAATVGSGEVFRIAQEAVRQVRAFVAEDGLQLSDRLWRNSRQARDQIVNAIEQAVVRGYGASQAAAEFLTAGKPVPGDLLTKINEPNFNGLSKLARQTLTGAGSPMENAMRLFRTELNRAHGEAYMATGEDHPDFAGWRYLLSPMHPKPDICDLYAHQNIHGLGRGVYPSRAKCPWPAHPNTLSFIEIVFKDEVTAADRAGRQRPMDALGELTPAQRIGVLGVNKAEAFNDGTLTQGMIRARWAAVKRRIEA